MQNVKDYLATKSDTLLFYFVYSTTLQLMPLRAPFFPEIVILTVTNPYSAKIYTFRRCQITVKQSTNTAKYITQTKLTIEKSIKTIANTVLIVDTLFFFLFFFYVTIILFCFLFFGQFHRPLVTLLIEDEGDFDTVQHRLRQIDREIDG